MKRTRAAVTTPVIAALALCVLGGCSSCGDAASAGAAASSGSAAPAPVAPVGEGRRSTSADIAVRNLEARIKSAERKLANPAGSTLLPRTSLAQALLDRAGHLGKVSDLDRALQLEGELAAEPTADGGTRLLRASLLSGVHAFDKALGLVDEAEKAFAPKPDVVAKRATIWLAQGKYDQACPVFAELSSRPNNSGALMMQAVCVAQLGRIDEADKLFADAEAAYRDVSPFMYASLWFERGMMWERQGDADKAASLYRAALERLPQHAHAATHLAQLDPPDKAEATLAPVMPIADDPEVKAVLGLAKEKIAAGSGKALIDEAKAAYDALMQKHPLAFADHAGWFYLKAVNDPARAAEVARQNLTNRQTHEAYELAIAAFTAAGNTTEACEAADEALERKWVPPALRDVAVKAYEACGKADKAAEAKKR